MPDIIDAINLKGAAFCIEHKYFEFAEEMLSELTPACSASSRANALRQRIRDVQITFWQTRHTLASAVSSRFPAYLPGRLYLDFCRSCKQAMFLGESLAQAAVMENPSLGSS